MFQTAFKWMINIFTELIVLKFQLQETGLQQYSRCYSITFAADSASVLEFFTASDHKKYLIVVDICKTEWYNHKLGGNEHIKINFNLT